MAQSVDGWRKIANANDYIPGVLPSDRNFNSFNQPSVNGNGLVVFRGRSEGHGKGPVSGIFKYDTLQDSPMIELVAAQSAPAQNSSTLVPQPNNQGVFFIEFPAFPRVSLKKNNIATRGLHQPSWIWTNSENAEELVGTNGVYVQLEKAKQLATGANLHGSVPADFSSDYDVPYSNGKHDSGVRFSMFPGAPSITDNNIIAFKGNFEDADGFKTGVFFRKLQKFDNE